MVSSCRRKAPGRFGEIDDTRGIKKPSVRPKVDNRVILDDLSVDTTMYSSDETSSLLTAEQNEEAFASSGLSFIGEDYSVRELFDDMKETKPCQKSHVLETRPKPLLRSRYPLDSSIDDIYVIEEEENFTAMETHPPKSKMPKSKDKVPAGMRKPNDSGNKDIVGQDERRESPNDPRNQHVILGGHSKDSQERVHGKCRKFKIHTLEEVKRNETSGAVSCGNDEKVKKTAAPKKLTTERNIDPQENYYTSPMAIYNKGKQTNSSQDANDLASMSLGDLTSLNYPSANSMYENSRRDMMSEGPWNMSMYPEVDVALSPFSARYDTDITSIVETSTVEINQSHGPLERVIASKPKPRPKKTDKKTQTNGIVCILQRLFLGCIKKTPDRG